MPEQPSSDAALETRRRTVYRLAVAAITLGVIGVVVSVAHLTTRAPCDSGYVRLVDFEWLGLIVSGLLLALSLVLCWRSLRGSHLKVIAGTIVVVLVCVAFVDLWAVGRAANQNGARYDSGCWTF